VIFELRDYLDCNRLVKTLMTRKQKRSLFELIEHYQLPKHLRVELALEALKYNLEAEDMDVAVGLLNEYSPLLLEAHAGSTDAVIASLGRTVFFYEYKLYLFQSFFEGIKYKQIEQFLTIIEETMEKTDQRSVLVRNANPLKLCLMLIHIVEEIKAKFPITYFRVEQLREIFEAKAKKVVEAISNGDELKLILKQKDLQGHDCLWFMAQHNVYTVLDTRVMDRIMQDFWKSNIDVTGNILETSTSYRLLSADSFAGKIHQEEQTRFYNPKSVKDFRQHNY